MSEEKPKPVTHHCEVIVEYLDQEDCHKYLALAVEEAYRRINARALKEDQIIVNTIQWSEAVSIPGHASWLDAFQAEADSVFAASPPYDFTLTMELLYQSALRNLKGFLRRPAVVVMITAQRVDKQEMQEAQMRAAMGQRAPGGLH